MGEIVPEQIGFEWYGAEEFDLLTREDPPAVTGTSVFSSVLDSYGSSSTKDSLKSADAGTAIAEVVASIKDSGVLICGFDFTPDDTEQYLPGTDALRFGTKWNTSWWEKYTLNWVVDGETVRSETLYYHDIIVAPARDDVCYWTLNGEPLTAGALMPKEDTTIVGVKHDWGEPVFGLDEYDDPIYTFTCSRNPSHVYTSLASWITPSALMPSPESASAPEPEAAPEADPEEEETEGEDETPAASDEEEAESTPKEDVGTAPGPEEDSDDATAPKEDVGTAPGHEEDSDDAAAPKEDVGTVPGHEEDSDDAAPPKEDGKTAPEHEEDSDDAAAPAPKPQESIAPPPEEETDPEAP